MDTGNLSGVKNLWNRWILNLEWKSDRAMDGRNGENDMMNWCAKQEWM